MSVETKSWQYTLEKSVKAIVSIKANHVRNFDTEVAGGFSATGFIVDKERGFILSNRHVISGPIVAQAVFKNYEEVELQPIYSDPIHDFGFFKFDPSKIEFMELEQIPLCPEKAKFGMDIRVVGNDNGESMSILSGTLARLDRRAPFYGVGHYNDFNTFYFQASTGSSGGSSGSPVLDIEGNAVALNSGGTTTSSSSFYLPLDRVKRALKYLQEGKEIPRGTLQAEFEYKPFDELRRMGLKLSIEKQFREKYPNENGLLVVHIVLPEGPADGQLIPGDIVIYVNKDMLVNFTQLFSIIDDSIGEDIELTILRGRTQMDVKLKIQDLYSITPNRYFEVGAFTANELSYQLAHSYSQAVGGPYIPSSGLVIVSINNIPTPNLDAFIDAAKTLQDCARVPLKTHTLYNIHEENTILYDVDRFWHKFLVAVYDENTGLWNYEDLPSPSSVRTYEPVTAHVQVLDESLHPAGKIWPSFVKIHFYLPHNVSGIKYADVDGAGIVVSTEPPLIICDRFTVPINIGDILITFANSIVIPGKLVYLHPIYNYAILSYDKSLLGETLVKAIELSDSKDLEQGDSVYSVGICEDYTPVIKKTTVTSIVDVFTSKCEPPRWRAMNVEEIKVDETLQSAIGGVLCDNDGKVQGLWLTYSAQFDYSETSFLAGFPISLLKPTLDLLKRGEFPKLYGLDVEFWTKGIAEARDLGLSDEWVKKIESKQNTRKIIMYILHILDSESPSGKLLKVGDIILTINGNTITKMGDLPAAIHYSEEVDMLILRDKEEVNIKVATTPYCDKEITRVVEWSGALIQETYKAAMEQVKNVPTGVYVSNTFSGSPAYLTIPQGLWIVEIEGRKVSDLDSFLEAIREHEKDVKENPEEYNSGYITIKTINVLEVTTVVTMKLDPHYWGTWQLVEDEKEAKGWKYIDV